MKLNYLIVLGFCVALIGCTTCPKSFKPETEIQYQQRLLALQIRDYPVSRTVVYDAITAMLKALGFESKHADAKTGYIDAEPVNFILQSLPDGQTRVHLVLKRLVGMSKALLIYQKVISDLEHQIQLRGVNIAS